MPLWAYAFLLSKRTTKQEIYGKFLDKKWLKTLWKLPIVFYMLTCYACIRKNVYNEGAHA